MRTFLVWTAIFVPSILLGCDVCGVFVGIQPYDRNNSISLIYRYRHLQGELPMMRAGHHDHSAHAASSDERTHQVRDLLQVAELRGDFWVGQRFNVLGMLTAANNYRAVDGYINNDVYGISDPVVIGRYLLVNTRSNGDAGRTAHRILTGVGVKAPLGDPAPTYNGVQVPMEHQLGSGSWDVLGTIEYLVRKERNGFAMNLIGRRNGVAADGHCMGSSLSITAELFRRYEIGEQWRMMPCAGVYHETMGNMSHEGVMLAGTGGSTLFTHTALRAWYRNWGVQAVCQFAAIREQGRLMVPNRERVIIGITYNLTKN